MTKPIIADAETFGFNIYWVLRLLAQLPPIELDFPIPDSVEKLLITLDLKIKP